MSSNHRFDRASDEKLDITISILLAVGLAVAALVVVVGGGFYLVKYGSGVTHYAVFRGEPSDLRSISGIWQDAIALRSRGLIQLGVLLLILTPIARVVFSAFAFLWRRDYTYVLVTLIVLGVLVFNLVKGP